MSTVEYNLFNAINIVSVQYKCYSKHNKVFNIIYFCNFVYNVFINNGCIY